MRFAVRTTGATATSWTLISHFEVSFLAQFHMYFTKWSLNNAQISQSSSSNPHRQLRSQIDDSNISTVSNKFVHERFTKFTVKSIRTQSTFWIIVESIANCFWYLDPFEFRDNLTWLLKRYFPFPKDQRAMHQDLNRNAKLWVILRVRVTRGKRVLISVTCEGLAKISDD